MDSAAAPDDPLDRRARVREALSALSDASPELGVPVEESAHWRASASVLGDPVLVALAGEAESGKTTLAAAIGGEPLESADAADGAGGEASGDEMLRIWKYGFEPSDVLDGEVLECYRPAPDLRTRAFVEIAPAAFAGDAMFAERAYTMSDVMLMVFSADDPWDRTGWTFLRGMHKRRERPAAAVLTRADGRTEEEVEAIVDHLRKTSEAAIAEEVPVFVVTGFNQPEGVKGVAELAGWIGRVCSERPAFAERLQAAESTLLGAAERAAAALRSTVDDTDAEAECVRWMAAECSRERDAANAEAAGAMAPAREVFQDRTGVVRKRLARALGPLGLIGVLFRGGGWLRRSVVAAAETAAQRAEEGARAAVRGTDERLAKLRHRIGERVSAVFDEEAAEALPPAGVVADGGEVGRKASARVREAAGDREAGAAIAARVSARRWLVIVLLGIVFAALAAGALLVKAGEVTPGIFAAGAGAVVALWGAVFLRGRNRDLLASYDREVTAAREAIGRDLSGVTAPVIGGAFDQFEAGLEPLRQRSEALADERSTLRARVLDAIELAAEGTP